MVSSRLWSSHESGDLKIRVCAIPGGLYSGIFKGASGELEEDFR